jgi:nucleotide-binding universal stress UspA family protein
MFPLNGLGTYFCDQTDIADSIAAAKNEAIANMTERLAPRFANCACDIKYTAVVGSNIAEGIVDYAEEANVDLIIMGCRGLGAVRAAIGSVSQAVLRQVPMPVMLLK